MGARRRYPVPTLEEMTFVDVDNYATTEQVVGLLVRYNAIDETVKCDRSGCEKRMVIKYVKKPLAGGEIRTRAQYECNAKCRAKRSILSGSALENCHLSMPQVWHCFASYILGLGNIAAYQKKFRPEAFSAVRQEMYAVSRDILLRAEHKRIGGPGIRIQADETFLISGQTGPLPVVPSNTGDDHPGAIIVVGAIEERSDDCWAVVVPDRTAETMTAIFRQYVRPGTILITDGHASYPCVARDLGFEHHIVNHTEGRVNEDGDDTQKVERLWAYMKSFNDGVTRDGAELFVSGAIFRKRFIEHSKLAGLCMLIQGLFDRVQPLQ